jgi:hypothetical protein
MPTVSVPVPGAIPSCRDRDAGGDCGGRIMSAKLYGLDGQICRRHYDRRYRRLEPQARPPAPAADPTSRRERPEKRICPACGGAKGTHHRWCAACERVAVRALEPTTTTSATPAGDADLAALAEVSATLGRLDAAARSRVLAFVAARFGEGGER